MTKKVLLSILLTIFLLCSAFGATMAFAAEEPVGDAVVLSSTSEKVATYSMKDNLPSTGYPAGTTMEFKDGDAIVATIKVDTAATKAMNGEYKAAANSKFTLVPSNKYVIKKVIFALEAQKSASTFKIDATQGTSMGTAGIQDDQAAQDLLTQAGVPFNATNSKGIVLNSDYVATEQTPYSFTNPNGTISYATICLIYEKLPVTETVNAKVSWGSQWLDAGPIKVGVLNTGHGDSGWGSTIKTSSNIEIKPAPGYVILSVTLNSSRESHVLSSASYISGADGLNVVKDTLGYTFTGFEVGKDYVLGNRSDATWYVRDIIVTYIEHDHAPEDLTLNHDETNHWDDCICRAKVNEQAHDFVDGEITKQPADGLPGEQPQTCQVCSAEVIKYLPCPITDPALTVESAGQLRYNGQTQAQKVIIKAGDVELVEGVDYTLSNNGAIDIDDYTLTITGIGNYSGTREFDFSIKKGQIPIPEADQTVFYYNGQTQYYNLPTSAYYEITGASGSAVNNNYTATLTLLDKNLYEWEDGTTSNKTYEWEIKRGIVPIPAEDPTVYKFTGQSYQYQIERNDDLYNITYKETANNPSGIAAQMLPGEYIIEVTLKDKTNYEWSDGTYGTLTYKFVILEGEFDMSEVVFENKEVVYDGTEHSIEATNLPDGVSVTYTYQQNGQTLDGLPTARGEYLVTANFEPADSFYASYYKTIEPMTAVLSITKGKIAKPAADPTEFVYNGLPQTYNLAPSVNYTFSGDSLTQTNARTYTITVSLNNPEDCQWDDGSEEDLVYTFVIAKATYDMNDVVFEGKTVTYDGNTYSLEAINLPDGVSVSYENNNKSDAGEYTVVAYFTGNVNYNDIESKTATLIINKATYDMSDVVFEGKTVTYNGSAFSLEATNLPEGVTASYENNGKTDVGEYTVTVNFVGSSNYNDIVSQTATLTINKATYDMSGVVFEDKTVTYNGSAQSILATNLPDGVTATYQGNEKTVVGEYTITVNFVGSSNYNDIESQTATLVIEKAILEKPALDETTFIYNGSVQTYAVESSNLYTVSGNVETLAGTYTVEIALKDTANSQWADGTTANLAYDFVIAKATYDMSGVVFADTTVTYNGSAQSILATNQPDGVTATYEGNEKTVVGEYTITATFAGNENYNAIPSKTATLTIAKATVEKPAVDQTAFVYNGNEQTYQVATSNLYTVAGNKQTLADAYTVEIALKDKANYQWEGGTTANLTYNFVIAKATYDMSAVVFADRTVVYNGSEFSIEATNLPNGVTVSYENNGKTDAGQYVVTAIFTGNANYNTIANKTATLTIKNASIIFNTDAENETVDDVVISATDGIDPTKELVVEAVEEVDSYEEFISKNQKVAIAYDIKLLKDGASVQPEGTLQFRVLIPEELMGKDFSIIHIHNGNETSVIEYQIDGDYVVFESDKLSEFIFVYDAPSMLWLIIVLAISLLLGIVFLVIYQVRKRTLAVDGKDIIY